jgi:hypothetical protein
VDHPFPDTPPPPFPPQGSYSDIDALPRVGPVTTPGVEGRTGSPALRLEAICWVNVLTFVTLGDAARVGRVSRWLHRVHLVDHVWEMQLRYVDAEWLAARGGRRMFLDHLNQPAASPRDRCRLHLQVQRADFARQWAVPAECNADLPLRRDRNGVQSTEALPLGLLTRLMDMNPPSHRILPALLALYMISDRHGHSALSPPFVMSLCDALGAGALQSCRQASVAEVTHLEDPDWLMMLQIALSPRFAGDNMLHNLGPRIHLVELSRAEASAFARSVLHDDGLLDLASPESRCFTGPELCRRGKVGMVVADRVRFFIRVAMDN